LKDALAYEKTCKSYINNYALRWDMLDIKLLREQPDIVRANLERRKEPGKIALLDEFLEKDKRYRGLLRELEELRAEKNKISREIGTLKKEGKDASLLLKKAEDLPGIITSKEIEVEELKGRCHTIHMSLPNLLHESVPYGEGGEGNVVVKTFGKIPNPGYPLKSHVDLLREHDLANLSKASEISGARFAYLKRGLVLLDMALQQFAMHHLVKKGFIPISPPHMISRKAYEGVTDLADFENVLYKIEDEDLFLIATAEHPMAALMMNEVISEEELPLKLAGISPCYRKEAGSHGKDTKGIFRVHQFYKIEQFIFCKPEDSWRIHEELQKNAEELYEMLGLPYHVVNICTGDIGIIAAKKYDIETWFVSQGAYRETGSNSNCTDYQARRLNIKFGKEGGEKQLVHTLNNTALATSRIMVAIIENFQQKDGTITIPEVLWPYMGGKKTLP